LGCSHPSAKRSPVGCAASSTVLRVAMRPSLGLAVLPALQAARPRIPGGSGR
jgi:hypothetical protein